MEIEHIDSLALGLRRLSPLQCLLARLRLLLVLFFLRLVTLFQQLRIEHFGLQLLTHLVEMFVQLSDLHMSFTLLSAAGLQAANDDNQQQNADNKGQGLGQKQPVLGQKFSHTFLL